MQNVHHIQLVLNQGLSVGDKILSCATIIKIIIFGPGGGIVFSLTVGTFCSQWLLRLYQALFIISCAVVLPSAMSAKVMCIVCLTSLIGYRQYINQRKTLLGWLRVSLTGLFSDPTENMVATSFSVGSCAFGSWIGMQNCNRSRCSCREMQCWACSSLVPDTGCSSSNCVTCTFICCQALVFIHLCIQAMFISPFQRSAL